MVWADREICPFSLRKSMRTAVPEFPEARLRELADRYAAAVAAKRRRVWLGSAVLIAAAIAAGWMGDVNFGSSSRISGAFRPILQHRPQVLVLDRLG